MKRRFISNAPSGLWCTDTSEHRRFVMENPRRGIDRISRLLEGRARQVHSLATASAPVADGNPFAYVSGYHDRASGLIKFGTRYFVPSLGTWTQRDPKNWQHSEPLSMNGQGYSVQDPIYRSDPSGRYWWDNFSRGLSIGISADLELQVACLEFAASVHLSASASRLILGTYGYGLSAIGCVGNFDTTCLEP